MNTKAENGEMDKIIRGALTTADSFRIPDDVVLRTIRKLERRALLRRIFVELFSKIGLAILCLAVLTGVLACLNNLDTFNGFFNFIAAHRLMVIEALVMGAIILLIDQVGLRYLSLIQNRRLE
jgi:hypothetical protein